MKWITKRSVVCFIISCFFPLQVSKVLGDDGPIWPEDPFHQAILLLESPISPDKSLILDAIYQEYQQGNKHYLSLGVGEIIGSAAVLIDLDDYYGISAEGKVSGGEWVTFYCRGGFDLHVSLLPVTVGYLVREDIDFGLHNPAEPNAADPYFDIEYFWGARATPFGYEFQAFNVVGHEGPSIDTSQWTLNYKLEAAKAWYTFGPFEVKKQVVEAWFNDLAPLNGPIPGQAVGTLVGQNIISQIFNFNPDEILYRFPTANDGVPSPPPESPDFEPAGIFFDTVMPVQLGTIFNIDLRIKNHGLAQGTGELLVYLENSDSVVEIVYDSKETSSITLGAASQTSLLFPLDTSSLVAGQYVLKTEIYDVTPSEASTNNNRFDWGFHITANPTGSIDSILPNPAIQGMDTIVFTASGSDPDNQGIPPEIRMYRWTSDLGKVNGQSGLYNGTEASFSMPASDLKAGTHNITFVVQDNEGDWSEPVMDTLTVNPEVPEEGHDLAITQFDVDPHDVVETDGEVLVNVTVTNQGDEDEPSFTVCYCLKNAYGQVLDEYIEIDSTMLTHKTARDLPPVALQSHGGYDGVATVEAKVQITLDANLANNFRSQSLYVGAVPSQDGYFGGAWTQLWGNVINIIEGNYQVQNILFGGGGTWSATVVNIVTSNSFAVEGMMEEMLVADGGNVVVVYFGEHVHHPDPTRYGIGVFSANSSQAWAEEKHCIVREEETAEWIVHQSSASAKGFDVVFSGDGPTINSWGLTDELIDVYTRRIRATPPAESAGNYEFWLKKGWIFEINAPEPRRYDDALSIRLELTVQPDNPPETTINTGPEGTITYKDVTFTWGGVDDWTPSADLQYACWLEPLEPVSGSFSAETEKTYNNLGDGEYIFHVKACDLGGNEDPNSASRSFTVATNHVPDLPVNQYPLPGQLGLSLTPTLVGSEFSDPDSNDMFAKGMFQVRSDMGMYDSPVWESGELSPGTINVQVIQEFTFDSTYWWRCRYQDDKGSWSPWSNETAFTTKIDWPLVDLDETGKIDFGDVAKFALHWRRIDCNANNNWCEGADFEPDGDVDFNDLAFLVSFWLEGEERPMPDAHMVFVLGDEFEMGDHNDEFQRSLPVHAVYVDSFYMSKYEITNQQYCNFLNSADVKVDGDIVYASSDASNNYPYLDTYSADSDSQITYSGETFSVRSRDGYNMADHPVLQVSWHGAAAYCNWRSQQEVYESCYDQSDPNWICGFSKNGYRLPTEAEWEYAARGGCQNPYYEYPWCDNNIDCNRANFWDEYFCNPMNLSSYPFTSPVGYYSANNFGLFDMAGNVWEWCNDWYYKKYYEWCRNICGEPCPNPTGPESGDERVLRGGSWAGDADFCKVAYRSRYSQGTKDEGGGFRLVRNAD